MPQQLSLLCPAANMLAVSHSRLVCSVTQQTYLLCHAANMCAVSHSRHLCRVAQQAGLLFRAADISAVPHRQNLPTKYLLSSAFREQPRLCCSSFVVLCELKSLMAHMSCRCLITCRGMFLVANKRSELHLQNMCLFQTTSCKLCDKAVRES